MEANFDKNSGLLNSIRRQNEILKLNVSFWQYKNSMSGAYLFSPSTPIQPWNLLVQKIFIIRGPILVEIHSIFSKIFHRIFFDVEEEKIWMKNRIDLSNGPNSEIVIRLGTEIFDGENFFYSDSNGFQMMKRKFFPQIPINSNYYPMAAGAFLESKSQRFSIFVDHPHGVTMPSDGTLEVMLDRRLASDDLKGLGIPDGIVNDNIPVESEIRILFESIQGPLVNNTGAFFSPKGHINLQQLLYAPIVMILNSGIWPPLRIFRPLSTPFPCDRQLLNIRFTGPNFSKDQLLLLHQVSFSCNSKEKQWPAECADGDTVNFLRKKYSSDH